MNTVASKSLSSRTARILEILSWFFLALALAGYSMNVLLLVFRFKDGLEGAMIFVFLWFTTTVCSSVGLITGAIATLIGSGARKRRSLVTGLNLLAGFAFALYLRLSVDLPDTRTADSPEASLAIAAGNRSYEGVERLLDGGADPNGVPGSDERPLERAVKANDLVMASRLLRAGAKIESTLGGVSNALEAAAFQNNREMLRLVLAECDVEFWKEHSRVGDQLLFWAAYHDSMDMAKEVFDSGYRPSLRREGYRALICAISKDNAAIILLLLARGVDVNSHGKSGWPLEHAIREGKHDIASLLRRYGANPPSSTKQLP